MISMLSNGHLFLNLAMGETPSVELQANGYTHNMPYYLADDIYPMWETL
jgi:hypothetical protein